MRQLDRELSEYLESMVEELGRSERRQALELYLTGLLLDGEQWLERFAIEYAEACGASACAYGWDWPIELIALEPEQLVTELRNGKLLRRPLPGFYLLAQTLLGKEELASLLLGQERDSRLRYVRTPSGYHVLSSLVLVLLGLPPRLVSLGTWRLGHLAS
jgi:hypothetical protein